MAGTNREARLNLVITARDEAKQVVEGLANTLASTFDGLGAKIVERMGLNDVTSAVNTMTETMSRDMVRVGETFTSASKDSETYQRATIEALRQVTTQIESLERATVDGFRNMGDSMRQASEDAHGVQEALDFANLQMAGQMIEDVGKSITGFFKDAVMAAADFDQSVTNTAASLNSNLPQGIRLTTDQIKSLNDEALKLGQSGFFSANQIADAMNTLAKQGIDYQTIMGGAIDTVSSVAAANQEDVNQTANVVSDIIHEMGDSLANEFGPSLKDQMTGVGDAMTAAMHHARISMDDFLNSMKYVGPQASAMGLGVGDLSAQIALLGEHGIRGSQAGTTLRRMLTNLTPQSKEAAAMMQQLGLTTADGGNAFFDASGKMKSMADVQEILYDHVHNLTPEMQEMALKTIFGQYALSGMTAIANTSPEAFQKLTDAMHKTGVTQQLLADKSQGWGMEIQRLKAHYETLMKAIGEQLRPVVETLMQRLQALMTWWDNLSAPVRRTIVIIGAVTGVILILGGALFAVIGTIGMFITGFMAALPALAAVGSAFLPAIAVIGVITLAIIALRAAWVRDFGGIQEKTKVAWDFIVQQFDAAVAYIKPLIEKTVEDVKAWWHDMSGSFYKLGHEIYAVMVWLKPLWETAWDVIKSVAKAAVDILAGVFKGGFDVITGIIDFFVHLFTGQWSDMWDDVNRIANGVKEVLAGIFKGLFDEIRGIATGIADILGGISGKAYGWGANVISMFVDGIKSMISSVEDAVSSVASKVSGFLGFHSPTKEGPASDSDTWMPNMMNMLTDGIVQHTPKIEAAIGNVALGLKTSMTNTNVTSASIVSPAQNAAGRSIVVNINVDGRSARTDDALAEKIAQQFRTQIAMSV